MRSLIPALAVTLLTACGDRDPAPEAPAPTSSVGRYDDVRADLARPVRPSFDPGALQSGDTVLGLTVASVDVSRVLEDSVWMGDVVFEGDLVLHGVYQRHFEWPRVEQPCLHVIQPASIGRIPGFPPDPRTVQDPRTWFCFENADVAIELLGPAEIPREIVVAVDRYVVRRDLTDVFDTARLAEVIEVGPTTGATLRAP